MTGYYTEIVAIDIVTPTVVAGETITVKVRVKNLHTATIAIMVIAQFDSEYVSFSVPWSWVDAGVVHDFYGYFIMPSRDVTLHAYSYYLGTDEQWHQDDDMAKDVSLVEIEPEFSQFEIADYQKV